MAFLFDTHKVNLSGLDCELVVRRTNDAIGSDAFIRQLHETAYAVAFQSAEHSFIWLLFMYYSEKIPKKLP